MEISIENIFFTRPVHDWEVEVVSAFFKLLYSQSIWQGSEIKFARFLLEGNCWKWSLTIMCYLLWYVPIFLKRVFEKLKLPQEWHSSYGRHLWGKSWLWIIYERGMLLRWIGAICGRKVGHLLITSFIVRLQENMEFAFLVVRCYIGERIVGELETTIRTLYCFGSVEVSSFVFHVMYLERAKPKKL